MKRGKIIVVDVESTCWKRHRNPPGMRSEIIEIGICLLNLHTMKPEQKRSILVTPMESTVSEFCTKLTRITPEMLSDGGIPFAEACADVIRDYDAKNVLWGSWGDYDRKMFLKQCERRGVDYPFCPQHMNIKQLFADVHGEKMGMARALSTIGLVLEGRHHRGDDDAHNIARILAHMIDHSDDDLLATFWE